MTKTFHAIKDCRQTAAESPQKGFTLTELLVVITILGILSSLMLSGMLVARERQRAAKSSTTIRKLSELILPYYESYEVRRPNLPSDASITQLPTACFKELRRIATRRMMMLELPERPSDIKTAAQATHRLVGDVGDLKTRPDLARLNTLAKTSGVVLSEIPPSARRYGSIVSSASNAWVASGKKASDFTIDNVELLHMIVMRGPVADPDITSHFRPDEVSDVDKDGLPEFIDGWGRPIAFLRWPVGFNSAVQPIEGSAIGIDTMISEKGHRLVPLVFSAGSDGAVDIGVTLDSSGKDVNYSARNFDPFAYDAGAAGSEAAMNCFGPESLLNAVNLVPVEIGPAGKTTFAFRAERIASGSTIPDRAFQAIGSERDQNKNGLIESLDNVHNHDLTR